MDDDLPLTPSGYKPGARRPVRRRAGESTPVVPGGDRRRVRRLDPDQTEVVPAARPVRPRPAEDRRQYEEAAPEYYEEAAPEYYDEGESEYYDEGEPDYYDEAEPEYVPRKRRQAAPERGARRVRRKRPNYVRRWIMVILAALLAAVLVGITFVGCSLNSSIHNIQRRSGMLPSNNRVDKKVDGAQTMLLIGTDKRATDHGFGNSDSMMLVHFPKDRKHVYIISMLRDMWVPVPGQSWSKLNAAYKKGGPALTVQTFERFLNIHIDHVATIDFEGFVHLTTSLGGVTVNNKNASKQGTYNWPAGPVTVQGDEALAYVRQRHELKNGDLDRSERQRAVVRAIIGKALSAGVLTNPSTLTDFVDKASQTVVLDDTFGDDQVRGLITSMRIKSGEDVRSMMLPISGYGTTSRHTDPPRQSIDIIDREQVMDLARSLREDRMDDYWASHDHSALLTGNMPLGPEPEGPVPADGLGLEALPTAAPRRHT